MPRKHRRIGGVFVPDLTLDVEFTTSGMVVHKAASPNVTLNVLRSGTRQALFASGDVLQDVAANTARYDPSGGIRNDGENTNLIPYNVGANAVDAAKWASVSVTATWDTTYKLYTSGTAGAIKLVADAANPALHILHDDEKITLEAKYYMIGCVVAIVGGTSATDPSDTIAPCCGTNAADLTGDICAGVGTSGTRYRHVRTDGGAAYFEMWEKVLGTAADYYPGFSLVPSATAYPVALTMYEAVDVGAYGHGGFEWRGCMANATTPASATRETVQLLCADPTKLLPVSTDGEWAIAAEVAWGLHGDDYNAAHIESAGAQVICWARDYYGYCKYESSVGRYQARVRETDSRNAVHNCTRPATPYTSQWLGLTGKSGIKHKLWVTDTEAELFVGAADGEAGGVQDSGSLQLTDGFQLGAFQGSLGTVSNSTGINLDGVIRRLKFYQHVMGT